MKKFNLITKLIVLFFSANVYSQNNLEGIIVEKYYQANAADVTAAGTGLTTNHIVFRVYADLAQGWKVLQVQGAAGSPTRPLKVQTTTSFYNNNGAAINSVSWLDSYFALGAVGTNMLGILKTDDAAGSILTASTALQNDPGTCFGGPIYGTTGKDGVTTGTAVTPSLLGFTGSYAAQGALTANVDNVNGSWYDFGGSTSGTESTTNKVLIGQFTTDGIFSFNVNIQIKNFTTGASEDYVYGNAQGSEIVKTFLNYTFVPNVLPTLSFGTASPTGSGQITGSSRTFNLTSADPTVGGSLTSVKLYAAPVTGSTVGTPVLLGNATLGTAPAYSYAHTFSTNGTYQISAVSTDIDCGSTTVVYTPNITVAANQAPVITALTAISGTQFYPGQTVNLSCNAVDNDGTVASASFSVNGGTAISATASGSTYTATYTIPSNAAPGAFSVTATATDSYSTPLSTTSSAITFNVTANTPPVCSLTYPTNGLSLIAVGNPTATLAMSLSATASDGDNIASVQFYVDNALVGSGTLSSGSYTYSYTASPGTHTFYAKATDTYGAITNSSSASVDIADPNALSYKVKDLTQNCDATTYCMTVASASNYTVDNVIGYDISLSYDATKVTPTGNITLANTASGLINPSYVESAISIGTGASLGTMQITLNLNGTAPSTAEFYGIGGKDLFCIEFTKTTGFAAVDNAAFTNLAVQESYFTGVTQKPGTSGTAYSVKNTTYVSNLEFWSDNQAIKYDVANPSTYLKTDVKGSVSTTATGTSGATTLTVTSAAGLASGMVVVANGVPAGTTVASISGTTVTLSAATTAALSTTAVSFVSTTAVQPNTSGVFTHSLLNGQDLRVERDIAASTTVQLLVNAADAVLAKTLLLNGNFTPSVFQIMALDVNLDGVVSAGDVSQIKQRATLLIPEYRQAWNYTSAGVSNGQASKDWVFVDVARLSTAAYQISATFPANDNTGYSKAKVPTAPFNLPAKVTNYSTCPIVETETYKGIMLGDVNASYATFTANGLLKSENGAVVLDLASAVKEGNTFRIPVSFESTESANALDFAVRFNENNVSFAELNNVAVGMEASSFMNQADRTFRFTGFDVANFTVGATVAELVLQSNNETISEKDIIAELALINGKPVDVKFEKSSEAIQSVFNVSIYPNPSNGAFSVQATENAIVDVYDMNGKQITASQVISSNGKVNIDLNNVEAGVYLVRVQNETFSTTKRIVIEK